MAYNKVYLSTIRQLVVFQIQEEETWPGLEEYTGWLY